MSRQWRPDLDLARLSASLADEIVGATEQELAALSAASGYTLVGAAQQVRELIDAAAGDRGDAVPLAIAARVTHLRQH